MSRNAYEQLVYLMS